MFQPAFFIVCGDLVDAMPDKWPDIRKEQEADFMKVFKGLKVPLVCVCGNHGETEHVFNTKLLNF